MNDTWVCLDFKSKSPPESPRGIFLNPGWIWRPSWIYENFEFSTYPHKVSCNTSFLDILGGGKIVNFYVILVIWPI